MPRKNQDQYLDVDHDEDSQALVEDNRQKGLKDRVVDVLTGRPALFTYLGITCIGIGLLIPMWFLFYYPLDVQLPVYTRGSCMIATQYRFPCLVGRENVTDLQCALAGCCWYDEESSSGQGPTQCFHSLPASYTYKIKNSTLDATSIAAGLTAYSFADEVAGRPVQTPYNTSALPQLSATAKCPEPEHALLELSAPGALSSSSDSHPVIVNGSLLTIESNTGPEWDFFAVVTRSATGQKLVDTRLGATIASSLYTEITIVPASTAVYGLGQMFHSSLRRTFDWPPRAALFAGSRLFAEGAHPFYMCIEPSGDVHGVYLETSAPLEVQLQPGPSITFRLLDGHVRLHVLAGPTPADVSEQYTRLVGRPRLPPLWSLGFHMCREGDPDSFDAVVEAMQSSKIPFESDCVDSNALLPLGFEVDSELAELFQSGADKLHKQGRRLMAVAAPHLPLYRRPLGEEEEPYQPYMDADSQGLLLRDQNDTENLLGELYDAAGNRTWNVSYVDYTNTAAVGWATPLYETLINEYGIDGFYLMRNSPTNDAPDACNDSLPFVPGNSSSLSNGTVCMLATQTAGMHLSSHNQYGQQQTRMVREATAATQPHLLLTSSSTAPGSGALGGHFATGLTADWTSLQLALVQTMELGLYGLPQGGYPVCGSRNSTSISADDDTRLEALCLLWYQLIPYLPLAVSHYEAGHFARNPPQLSEAFQHQVLAHISQRYVFVPYHYTLLVEANRTGAPPLRPLWYEFAADNATWSIDQQLLLGPALMVAPALRESQQMVELYLPGSCWYEYFQGYLPKTDAGPSWVKLPVPSQQTLIYQRAATVIFNQQPSTTLKQQRIDGTYSATIALSCEDGYEASGTVYLPGNDADIPPEAVKVTVEYNSTVVITADLSKQFCDFYNRSGYTSTMEQVKIFGIMEDVANVTAVLTDTNGKQNTTMLDVNQTNNPPALLIEDLVLDWCLYPRAELIWMLSET